RSSEPLARALQLLPRGVDDPLLGDGVDQLIGDPVEPVRGGSGVADPAPELPYEIRQDPALLGRYTVVGGEGPLEHPGGLPAKESFSLDVPLVDAAPRSAQIEVGDVARLHRLPLGDLGRGLVLRRARHLHDVEERRRSAGSPARTGEDRRQLVPHMLLDDRTRLRLLREIALRAGVAAPAAHVDEVRKRLRPRRALVEIRPLAAKGVGGDDGLGNEPRIANWTPELDALQRRHRAYLPATSSQMVATHEEGKFYATIGTRRLILRNPRLRSGRRCRRVAKVRQLSRAGPQTPGQSARGDRWLDHSRAQIVPAPLGENVTVNGARLIAHAAGEIAEA